MKNTTNKKTASLIKILKNDKLSYLWFKKTSQGLPLIVYLNMLGICPQNEDIDKTKTKPLYVAIFCETYPFVAQPSSCKRNLKNRQIWKGINDTHTVEIWININCKKYSEPNLVGYVIGCWGISKFSQPNKECQRVNFLIGWSPMIAIFCHAMITYNHLQLQKSKNKLNHNIFSSTFLNKASLLQDNLVES